LERKIFLISASYLFYAFWDWRFCALLLFSTAVNYGFGYLIGINRDHIWRKTFLIFAVIFALLHSFISCAGFLIGNALNSLVGTLSRYLGSAILMGVGLRLAKKSVANPCSGISQANIFLVLLGAGTEDFAGGVSVGTFGGDISVLILLFFAVSIPMNLLAFRIGSVVIKHIDFSMDLVTGLLLIALGVLSAFGIL